VVKRLSLALLCAAPLLVALPNRLDAQGGTIRGRVADAQGVVNSVALLEEAPW